MLPIIWRYLIVNYLKILTISLVSIAALLLILRVEEIARFATLGAPASRVIEFSLLLIPHTLPLALPLSAFIATYLTMKKLSQSKELLALVTSGAPLSFIVTPFILFALLIGTANAWVSSEWSTSSHLRTKELKHYWSGLNPFHLIQNQTVWHLPNSLVISKPLGEEDPHHRVYLINHLPKDKKMQFMVINNLQNDKDFVVGDQTAHLTFFSPAHSSYLLLENLDQMKFRSLKFIAPSTNEPLRMSPDHLSLRLLWSKVQELKKTALTSPTDFLNFHRFQSDLYRRLYFLLLPLSLTCLAIAIGITLQTRSPQKHLALTTSSILLLLSSFFLAKVSTLPTHLNAILYLLPALLVIFLCTLSTHRTMTRRNS